MTTWPKAVGARVRRCLTSAALLLPACVLDAHAIPGPEPEEEASAEQAVRCEIALPDDPTLDLDHIAVRARQAGVDPRLVPEDIGAPCNAGADGWQLSYDLTSIHVCGPTCDALRADPSARLELVLTR
jgi:hypothetical protein